MYSEKILDKYETEDKIPEHRRKIQHKSALQGFYREDMQNVGDTMELFPGASFQAVMKVHRSSLCSAGKYGRVRSREPL